MKIIFIYLVLTIASIKFATSQIRTMHLKETKEDKPELIAAFNQNKIYVSAGYGAPWLGSLASTVVGPIYGKFEYAITNSIGIGLNLAYATNNNPTNKISTFSALGRFNFHALPKSEIADLYMGLGMGYRYFKENNQYTDLRDYPIGMDLTLGFRILIANNMGIFGEIGLAKSPFQIGLSVRL
ncbi:MAG: hypothetical protein RL708_1253 [Bacteroidota bacterium]|jgi:hypothetical protein